MPNAAPAPGGLLEHAREFTAAGLEYLQARLALAGLETKHALLHFGIIIGLLAAAVAVLIFGYLFLCIAIVALIAHFVHVQVGWVLLAVALAHLGVAAGCVLFARNRLSTSVYSGTLSEFKKDQQWLSNRNSK